MATRQCREIGSTYSGFNNHLYVLPKGYACRSTSAARHTCSGSWFQASNCHGRGPAAMGAVALEFRMNEKDIRVLEEENFSFLSEKPCLAYEVRWHAYSVLEYVKVLGIPLHALPISRHCGEGSHGKPPRQVRHPSPRPRARESLHVGSLWKMTREREVRGEKVRGWRLAVIFLSNTCIPRDTTTIEATNEQFLPSISLFHYGSSSSSVRLSNRGTINSNGIHTMTLPMNCRAAVAANVYV